MKVNCLQSIFFLELRFIRVEAVGVLAFATKGARLLLLLLTVDGDALDGDNPVSGVWSKVLGARWVVVR